MDQFGGWIHLRGVEIRFVMLCWVRNGIAGRNVGPRF